MAQKTQSKYAAKLASGKMMYGGRGSESCCAHRITDAQLAAARARARQSQEEERKRNQLAGIEKETRE